MTVLVTGGCGYIGAHVVHALHQAGEKVVVVDDLSYGKPTRIEGSRLYGMDIAAPGAGERLAEILDAEGVDSVIHFAARKQVGESVEKPLWYYQQNINGMLNVLTGMTQSKNAKKLVFSSSAARCGARGRRPDAADQPLRPDQAVRRVDGTRLRAAVRHPLLRAALLQRGRLRPGRTRRPGYSEPHPDAVQPPQAGQGPRHLRRRLPDPGRHLRARLHPRLRLGRRPHRRPQVPRP